MVCLHGVGGYGGRFRRLAQERLASRFRVVALDLRGHGHSEWEPPWDLDSHVADLVETTSALGIERAHWIGHSFGGRLVMELAERAPDRIDRAVLLDPAIWVPPPIALERAEAERADVSFANVDEAIEQRIAASELHHSPRKFIEEEMAEHLVAVDGRLRYRYCKSAVVAAYAEMAKPPPPFESLRLPTLLVRGAQTDVVPEIYVDLYSEGIGKLLEVVTVPGGHTVLWDAFEESAAAVDGFLSEGAE